MHVLRALLVEQRAMMAAAAELTAAQDGEQRAGTHGKAWWRGLLGDWEGADAGRLWHEVWTGTPTHVLIAAAAAVVEYGAIALKAPAQGSLLDLFAASAGPAAAAQGSFSLAAHPSAVSAALRLLLLLLAEWAAAFAREWAMAMATAARHTRSRVAVFASIMVQDAAWLDVQGSTSLAGRARDDGDALDDVVLHTPERCVRGAAALLMLGGLLRADAALTCLALALRLPQILQLVEFSVQLASAYERLGQASMNAAQATATEAVAHARVLQVLTAEAGEVTSYAHLLAVHSRVVKASALAVAALRHAEGVLLVVTEFTLLAAGGYRIVTGRLTVGGFLAFRTLVGAVIWQFHGLEEVYKSLRRAALLSRRFFALRDRTPAVPLSPPAVAKVLAAVEHGGAAASSTVGLPPPRRLAPCGVRVDIVGVAFAYPAPPSSPPLPPVLASFTLSLARGTCTALVGSSGGGKSTLARLLTRSYDPDGGHITIDGLDIRTMDTRTLRRSVAVVDQDATMFNRSVAANIAIGCYDEAGRPPSRAAIVAAAQAACAHDFIVALAEGYDTIVGERGGRLSGGQRARLAIARALVRDPCLLVLDEATAALDAASEAAVTAGVRNACAGRTVIAIAHRLASSLVRHADVIAVVEGGRVVQAGSHEQLLAAGGAYSALLAASFSRPV